MADNDGYGGNINLKRVGEEIAYTEEQTQEIIKCVNDPVYFVKKYMKIVNVDKGLIPFDMWDFQADLLNSFNENRFNIVKYPRQSGKCFCINTNVKVRNKLTGEIEEITIGNLYEREKTKKKLLSDQ